MALALAAMQVSTPRPDTPPIDAAARLEALGSAPAPVLSLLRRACYDCHSSETRWPWYSHVAPMSFLVVHDVTKGRGQLNWSRWRDYNPYDRADLLDKVCELTTKKTMPPAPYLWLHADAELSDPDVRALCAWTDAEAARLTSGK